MPNLKDRRNQRRNKNQEEETKQKEKSRSKSNSGLISEDKFLEIEKIKESAYNIGGNRNERRQSRARAFSKMREKPKINIATAQEVEDNGQPTNSKKLPELSLF